MRFLLFLAVLLIGKNLFSQLTPQNGVAPSKAKKIALVNARIVVSPDKIIEDGTLIIQGDEIIDVGHLLITPSDAVKIDCKGATILPAFIELNSSIGMPKNEKGELQFRNDQKKGAYHWNEAIHPETNASELFSVDQKANEALVKMGYGFAVTHVNDGIFRGNGSFVSLGNENSNKQLLHPLAAQFLSYEKGSARVGYPSSQMGSIALIRQTFYDAQWYSQGEACESNLSLGAINDSKKLPFIFQTSDKLEMLRAEKIATEFNLRFNYFGSGSEYMAIDKLKFATGYMIVPFNFPEPYDVKDPYVARQIPLSDLKHWELAPSNPYILRKNGVSLCFTSQGQNQTTHSPDWH